LAAEITGLIVTDRPDATGDDATPLSELAQRRAVVRGGMGGPDRVARLRAEGRRTIRERIDAFADAGSFREIGTFAQSERAEDRLSTPGDGKVGGYALLDGRPVVVAGDDITVKRGSSSVVGGRKVHRLFDHAVEDGTPFVYFGETGGGRIPDMLGSRGFTRISPLGYLSARLRRVPMATVIVGESFGGSSFVASSSDLTVQVRGTCLSITSPRVVEVATGEAVSMEELGGADVHARVTGQVDLAVDTEDDGYKAVRSFLGYFPPNCWTPIARSDERTASPNANAVGQLVPAARRQAYDVRAVVRRLADRGSTFEMQPEFARSLVTILARWDGWPVGIVANQPMQQAGVLTPDACVKAAQFICLCDSFGLPLVFLHDTPGVMVGKQVEHDRALDKAMLLQGAVTLARVPKLSVVVRKSFGLAHHLMCGVGMGADLLTAWPGAEISFMDPDVGANVVHHRELSALPPAERAARLAELSADFGRDTDPFGAASAMQIDEIIEPEETRGVISAALQRMASRLQRVDRERLLASWPASL
jgi:acetyl-CoA carboxylase carboxyltransferase component